MLKFLKKRIDLIILIFFILLVMIFADRMIILPAGGLEAAQDPPKTSETTEADSRDTETENAVLNDGGIDKEVPGDSSNKEDTAEGTNKDKETLKEEDGPREEEKPGSSQEIKEEDIEGDSIVEEIKDETKEYDQSEYQDIDFTSSEDFRIEVDLSLQRVFIYYRDGLIREMVCSGGEEETPTPTGEYTTNEKIKYSWIPRFDVGAYYWIRFYGAYLFHSVPFDEDGDIILEEYGKLGSPASHGCIRLRLAEAKWLYDNLPLGVKVLIYPEQG